jgi:hypothetical protein
MGRPTRGAFFSSSRLASVSDLLPSPAAFAARARRQPSSRHRCVAAAPASPPPPAPPRLGTPGRPVVGPGTPLPASLLAAATFSWHLHSAPPSVPRLAPHARHLVACAPARTVEFEQVVRHQHVLRQRSQPRRTTCPPQRSSSSRLLAISSRPEPVR